MLASLLAISLATAPVGPSSLDETEFAEVLEIVGNDDEVFAGPADEELDMAEASLPETAQKPPVRTAQLAPAFQSNRNLECLAMAIYFEARGEPVQGQKAVSDVVMNRWRTRKLPSACAVTTQPGQFSNRSRWRKGSGESWQRAVSIASASLDGITHISSAIQFFHATSVRPGWNRRAKLRIGNHIFY